ncbi:conserved hypothetical protein [Methylocella tundrae]|nr:conserved hypothetical protein [Methylocella tundrae]
MECGSCRLSRFVLLAVAQLISESLHHNPKKSRLRCHKRPESREKNTQEGHQRQPRSPYHNNVRVQRTKSKTY